MKSIHLKFLSERKIDCCLEDKHCPINPLMEADSVEILVKKQNDILLQRQFNLYRYYLNQYPELFDEYFDFLRKENQQKVEEWKPNYTIRLKGEDVKENQLNMRTNGLKGNYSGNSHKSVRSTNRMNLKDRKSNSNIFLCKCSNCCQISDSSSTINDFGTFYSKQETNAKKNILNQPSVHVIQPPNDFSAEINEQKFQKEQENKILFCDKRTQTDHCLQINQLHPILDDEDDDNLNFIDYEKLHKKFQKQLSLFDYKQNRQQNRRNDKQQLDNNYEYLGTSINESLQGTSSMNRPIPGNNIYLTIQELKSDSRKFGSEFQLKKDLYRNGMPILDGAKKRNTNLCDSPYNQEELHRLARSTNGLPCNCERCRDSRGMNLTTELLPIDTQIPLHTMYNIDTFFQDSSMAQLFCRII